MVVMAGRPRPGWQPGWCRWPGLLVGRSKLRTFDRLEGLIVVPLFAAFIAAVAAAPYFGPGRAYGQQAQATRGVTWRRHLRAPGGRKAARGANGEGRRAD